MIGDSIATDIAGAHAIGMPTVLYAPSGCTTHGAADFVVSTFAELARLAGV
jgi:FMN phosphatase YigB (HAD superfamily)